MLLQQEHRTWMRRSLRCDLSPAPDFCIARPEETPVQLRDRIAFIEESYHGPDIIA